MANCVLGTDARVPSRDSQYEILVTHRETPMPSSDPAGSVTRAGSLAGAFLAPFMKLAAVQPGERVLDVLAGSGEAAVEAARRAGETGEALVLDTRPEALAAV